MAEPMVLFESTMSAGALVEKMADAATRWLASLSVDQRRKAQYEFPANDRRMIWYYTPTEQGGLPLAEMDPIQQRLANRLLATGLSKAGYVSAAVIMALENILDASEGWTRLYTDRAVPNRGRDPNLYFFSVFGTPGGQSWGWRVGGHHISLHYTIVDGRIATPTPMFFGANPAESHHVGPGILRPLAGEEDLGRELLHALSTDQRGAAVLSPIAPTDIVQRNRIKIQPGAENLLLVENHGHDAPDPAATEGYLSALRYESAPKGLVAARMTAGQRQILTALIRQYVDRLPEEVAEFYRGRLTGSALDSTHFAWAGGGEKGQGHYYRVQGPRLLIEYDNTQNDTNHIHAVWRDPEGDFGADILALHYQHAH